MKYSLLSKNSGKKMEAGLSATTVIISGFFALRCKENGN
jgi:hypothetical protein